MGRLFDLVVAVDWSASAVPVTGPDSIWIAASDGTLRNPPTRSVAAGLLDDLVAASPGRRILIGVDVPFGYPAGTAMRVGLDGVGWRAMWTYLERVVADDARNGNDRFAVAATINRRIGNGSGPFWGCPAGVALDGLPATKPVDTDIAEWRACEAALRRRRLRPFSVWQLAYPGSVGSQALTAIPVLERFRATHQRVVVWPFETTIDESSPRADAVVLAEVWPSAFEVDRRRHLVKDAAQVLDVVDEVVRADEAGALGTWFVLPGDVDAGVVRHEEGWILAPPPVQ